MSKVYPKTSPRSTMLSLATPPRSVAFVIPKRQQTKRGAMVNRHRASSEVVSRLSEEAKAFLVVQPLIQVFGPNPQLKNLLHEYVGVGGSSSARGGFELNVDAERAVLSISNGSKYSTSGNNGPKSSRSSDHLALHKINTKDSLNDLETAWKSPRMTRLRNSFSDDQMAFRRVRSNKSQQDLLLAVHKPIKKQVSPCRNGSENKTTKDHVPHKAATRVGPDYIPKAEQKTSSTKTTGNHTKQKQKQVTGAVKVAVQTKGVFSHDNHNETVDGRCALQQAYRDACRFHKRLVAEFQAAKTVVSIKRYHRLRAIIEEATSEHRLQHLRKGARHECTCIKKGSRERHHSGRGEGEGRSCDLCHVMMDAWGRLEALARSVIATAVSPSLADNKIPPEMTSARPTCADHVWYRSRIVLLQRHLERLGRDYEQSKRSWLPVRRYGAMKAMLERVTRAKIE